MTPPSRQKALIIAAVSMLSILALDQVILRPAWSAWCAVDVQLEAARARHSREKRLLGRKEELRREARRMLGNRGPGDVKAGGYAGLLKDIEAAARRSGMDIRDIRPRSTRGRDSVQIMMESSWESFGRFLELLHKCPRLLRIEKAVVRLKSEISPVLSIEIVIAEISPLSEQDPGRL